MTIRTRHYSIKKKKSKKLFLFKLLSPFFLILIILLTAGYFFLYKPLLDVFATVSVVETGIEKLTLSLKEQDLSKIKSELDQLNNDLVKVKNVSQKYGYLNKVPKVSSYYKDLEHIAEAGLHGVKVARILLEAINPFAEILGFKVGESSQPSELDTAVNKIVGTVKVAPQVVKYFGEIEPELKIIKQELNQIDPKEYPEEFRGKKIRRLFTKAIESINLIENSIPDLELFLTKLPSIMGEPTEKTYLILFQNDKELRPTGGFLTAYAIVKLKGGEIIEVESDDMYHLDFRIGDFAPPHPIFSRDLKVEHWFARDANFSPDFKVSADKFYWFWQLVPNPKLDGIFAIDTYVPQELLEVLGPVKVVDYEKDFTHENIVEELEIYATIVRKEQPGRKKLIGLLMEALQVKLFESPKEQWSALFKVGIDLLLDKHILLYSFDPEVQTLFEKYNLSGRVKNFEGDYLQVNDANLAGGKANWFVKERVTKEIREENGKIITTVTVDYENPEPHSEWNPPYRDYVRILVPKGSKLISSEGSIYEVTTEEDLGKTVFAGFNVTKPQGNSQLKFVYELPEGVVNPKNYRLLVQKQPGTNAHKYTVKMGDKVVEFELKRDKEVSL